jgi:hypothetical protein
MPPLPKNHVRLYNRLEDIESSVPYATEDANEPELVINRFVFFAQMVADDRNIAS